MFSNNNVAHPVKCAVSILLTCEKQIDDRIIWQRGEVWPLKTSLTPPFFIEVPAPSHGSEWSCIYVC